MKRNPLSVFDYNDYEDMMIGLTAWLGGISNPERYNIHDYDLFKMSHGAVVEDLLGAERLTVDMDILPEFESGEFHLPHTQMLIGLETESDKALLSKPISVVRAVYYLHAGYGKEDMTKSFASDHLFIPISWGGAKGKWMTPGFIIGWHGNTAQDENLPGIKRPDIEVRALPGYTDAVFGDDTGLSEEVSQWVITQMQRISTLLECSNITTETVHPSSLKKMRAKKHGISLNAYSRIKLPHRSHTVSTGMGGHHASPRFHRRAGHYRTYNKGQRYQRRIWIAPMSVGDPSRGRIKHEYQLRKSTKKGNKNGNHIRD